MKSSRFVNLVVKFINCLCVNKCFTVLYYHRVMPNSSANGYHTLEPLVFEQQLVLLKRHFCVLSLPDAIDLARQSKLPKNSVVITIDDGFKDCFTYIYPLLVKHKLKATFFITTSGLKDGYIWENEIVECIYNTKELINKITLGDKVFFLNENYSKEIICEQITDYIKYNSLSNRQLLIESLSEQCNYKIKKSDQFLGLDELRTIHSAGMTIGAHTVNHPILNCESFETAYYEIASSKFELEDIIGQKISFFAYPNGKYGRDFNDQHLDIVKNLNFDAAFSTEWGVVNILKDNLYRLKRFTPWDRDPSVFCLRLALSALSEQRGFSWLKKFVRQSNQLYIGSDNLAIPTNDNL